MSWSDIVNKTSALNIARLSHTSLVVLKADNTVKEALQALAVNNILSAPVVDQTRMLGFVDALDLVGFILHAYRRQSISVVQPQEGVDVIQEFFRTKVSEVINYSNSDFPVFVMENGPLKDVIDAMSGTGRRFKPHRVALLNTSQSVTNLLSQSDVIAFAAQHYEAIASTVWGQKTLQELNMPHSPIEVRLDTTFSDALRILYDNRISGLALVDYEGRLSANLSASDLRGINPESFDYFTGSVLQFLVKGSTTTKLGAPITCSPDTKLCDAIKLLASNRIHRLYIVNEAGRPLGVVSLSDIVHVLKHV